MDGGGGMTYLPEDVLIEIFSRVGNIKSLFTLAVTSRHWLRRFTDPSFVPLLCPGNDDGDHRARLLGFLFQQGRFTHRGSVSPPTFLPSPGSPLGRTDCALTTFDDGGDFNYAEPLASRRGIVLMRLFFCRVGRRIGRPILIKTRPPRRADDRHNTPPPRRLQPLERDHDTSYHLIGFAIITATDIDGGCSRRYAFSKLLVTTRGKLPFCAGGSPFLGITSDGKLSVACMFPVHARVWTEEDEDDDGTWVRSVIRIPTMVMPHRDYQILYEKCFDFGRGSMLLMYTSNGIGVFILDLEKEMEKVMDCFLDLSDDKLDRIETPVSSEMDLVEFFLLQLGGLRRDLQGI
uniref:F-box domain-containing protein n=1 Tax=Leersia perrieri TaxID=77586 RepID=A0A0D9VLL0_9ORYZ